MVGYDLFTATYKADYFGESGAGLFGMDRREWEKLIGKGGLSIWITLREVEERQKEVPEEQVLGFEEVQKRDL